MIQNTEIGVVLTCPEIAQGMGEWFDQNVEKLAFRLELKREGNGSETLLWHGVVNGTPQTFTADPYTGFWKRFGIGILGILPIESQL
jgi:putative cardiolipin synthase